MGAGKRAREKYYLNTRNRFRLIMRNFPWTKMPYVKCAIVVGEVRALGRAVLDGEWWKLTAHIKAWASGAAYWPRAISERTVMMWPATMA